jgi:hypothetical protein
MWFDKKIKEKQTEELIVQAVREILDKKGTFYDPITTSQWGMVHQAARSAKDYNALMEILFDDKKGVFETGSSKITWKSYKKDIRETIESMKDKNPVQFTMLLCLEMAKRAVLNIR